MNNERCRKRMMSAQLIFCAECGAANSTQAPYCFACTHPIAISPLSLSTSALPIQIMQATALSPPTSPGTLTAGSLLNQRYRIISEIGQGGFGIVYKAQDRQRKNQLVAIKEINLHALRPREIIEA